MIPDNPIRNLFRRHRIENDKKRHIYRIQAKIEADM